MANEQSFEVKIDGVLADKLLMVSKMLNKSPSDLLSSLVRGPAESAVEGLWSKARETFCVGNEVRLHSHTDWTDRRMPTEAGHLKQPSSDEGAWLSKTARRRNWYNSNYLKRVDNETRIDVENDIVLIALVTYGVDEMKLKHDFAIRCVKFLAGENCVGVDFLRSNQFFLDDLTLAYTQTYQGTGRAPRCVPSLLHAFGSKRTGGRRDQSGKASNNSYGGEEIRFDAPSSEFCRLSGITRDEINNWRSK